MRFSLLFFFTRTCVIKGVCPCALATSETSEGFSSCHSIMQQGTIPDLFLSLLRGRLRLKCDGTRAETRFSLSTKRTSSFKSAGASVQSTTGSRVVRISGSNGGYTKFRGSVKGCEVYWLPTPFASFPFTSPPVRHRVPSGFNWTLPLMLLGGSGIKIPLTWVTMIL